MEDPKLPAAKRRLASLLRDESYGPKLARLNKHDERVILDLIYENKGRQARQTLDVMDRERRVGRSQKGIARDYIAGKANRRRLGMDVRRAQWRKVRSYPSVVADESSFWELYASMVSG